MMMRPDRRFLQGRFRLLVYVAIVIAVVEATTNFCQIDAFLCIAKKELHGASLNRGLLQQGRRRGLHDPLVAASDTPKIKQIFASTSTVSPNDNKKENGDTSPSPMVQQKKEQLKEQIKKEGGVLSFQTKYGALNPFAIYWGLVSIALGLVWLVAIESCRLFYMITFNKLDKKRRLPVFVSHVWGTLLMRFSRSFPEIENRQYIRDMYKTHKGGAMFVANHSSWNDIPFLGATIGWRNYKFVAKKELLKVPILNEAMRVGGNVIIDRSDRRDQLKTLKAGISWLQKGVNLCTFPEGTRSKTGRVLKFKNGAFKMAHKAGAPVVPLSIVHANKVMPPHWMFPNRPARGICKVVVHKPIESTGKTEDELATEVRDAIISGLPDDQRPPVN